MNWFIYGLEYLKPLVGSLVGLPPEFWLKAMVTTVIFYGVLSIASWVGRMSMKFCAIMVGVTVVGAFLIH